MVKIKYILLILVMLIEISVSGQSSSSLDVFKKSSRLDSLTQKWNSEKTPGLSVAIIENNKIVYSANVGMANLKSETKITSKTTFNLASLTKQFVAYSILLLEGEGKLSLDEDIRKYLPEIKYSGIKVWHLLNHSSGIPEYWGIWTLSSFESDNIEDIYGLLKEQTQVKFIAGDKYDYSNSNYILLSLIIKKVSGLSLIDYARENIFKKLQMNHTYFLMDSTKLDSNQAENYQFNGQSYIPSPQQASDIVGDGGLFSSIEDLIIWNSIFYDNSVLANKRKEVGVLNSGMTTLYGAGLQKYNRRGVLSYEHGGGAQGASCYFAQFPDFKTSIIVLANTDEINAMAIYEEIKSIVFQENKDKTEDSKKLDHNKN